MFNDRIEGKWIETFFRTFDYCKVKKDEEIVILSETQALYAGPF